MRPRPPGSHLFPYTTLFRSPRAPHARLLHEPGSIRTGLCPGRSRRGDGGGRKFGEHRHGEKKRRIFFHPRRSEEHTSELQSLTNLVCRLLLEKKKKLIPLFT